jgi:predicted TIM-barrel fold metal-dependent hydrolase
MARNAPVVVDSDRHVIEPTDLWLEYLPAPLRSAAPRQVGGDLVLAGRSAFGNIGAAARRIVGAQAAERIADLRAAAHPAGQLDAMDRQGVDVAYLFPTYALYLAYVDGADAELSSAIASAYNRWLADYCRAAPDRLRGVGLIARHDPTAMLAELERVVSYGFSAVVLRPNPIAGRALNHPAYEPFWAACAARGIPVTFHEGTQANTPTVGADRFATRFAQHACSHPMEQMLAFLALLEAGVLHRHPDLRLAFLEAGASWLPSWLWRLDQLSWPHMQQEVREEVPLPPSTYFKRQCYVSFDPTEPGLDLVIETIGLDRLLFGSDYPHPDHGAVPVVEQLAAARTAHRAELVQAVLADNPARLFSSQQKLKG